MKDSPESLIRFCLFNLFIKIIKEQSKLKINKLSMWNYLFLFFFGGFINSTSFLIHLVLRESGLLYQRIQICIFWLKGSNSFSISSKIYIFSSVLHRKLIFKTLRHFNCETIFVKTSLKLSFSCVSLNRVDKSETNLRQLILCIR